MRPTPTKQATNHKGVVCNFSAPEHLYWTDEIDRFTSVTTFVKHYFPKFNAPDVAAQVAARTGKTTEALMVEWETKRRLAGEMGTRVHENMEAIIADRPPPNQPRSERERAIMAAGWQYVQDMRAGGWEFVATEQLVFSENMCLAGTIDLAARDRNRTLWILDWKTSETVDDASKYDSRAFYPLQHLPDCNAVHYALQLGTYEAILRHECYIDASTAVDRAVIHLTPDGARFIPMVDHHLEVLAMLAMMHLYCWDVPF